MSARRACSPRRRAPRWLGRLVRWLPLLCVPLATGCMTVTLYQPQRGLHRPVVVERTAATFAGLRVLVRCNAHDSFLPAGDATRLCGKLAQDFEAQGAEAEWVVPRGRNYVEAVPFEGEGADLTVEIESRIDHEDDYRLTPFLSACTCTLLPSVSEQTFSQRVVVIGRDRSVLTEEVFRERFVEYAGCGVWSLNWLLDWLVRSKEDAVSGDAPKERFTRDFYGQIRQLAFNARVRAEILGLLVPSPTALPTVEEPAADRPSPAVPAAPAPSGADPADGAPAAPSADELPPPPALSRSSTTGAVVY